MADPQEAAASELGDHHKAAGLAIDIASNLRLVIAIKGCPDCRRSTARASGGDKPVTSTLSHGRHDVKNTGIAALQRTSLPL
jgi:hypothetical protein